MSPSNTKLLAAIALVITFLVGGVLGVVGDRLIFLRYGIPHHSAQFIVHRLDRRLHFNDQQRAQVVEIIDRHQRRISGIWTGVRPAVLKEIETANVEIDRVLTPQQRVEFAKIRMRLMPHRTGDGIRFKHD
ncbi:MAG TPA: hypothetical protein VGK04_10600 [Thermoanaerobaculia bacterium]